MSHELSEKIAGLTSRVNNLAVNHTGKASRTFMELEDRLAKLLLASIVRDLEAEREAYKSAVNALDKAIAFIGEAREEIEDTAKVIGLVSKAIGAVEKALKVAAKLGGVP